MRRRSWLLDKRNLYKWMTCCFLNLVYKVTISDRSNNLLRPTTVRNQFPHLCSRVIVSLLKLSGKAKVIFYAKITRTNLSKYIWYLNCKSPNFIKFMFTLRREWTKQRIMKQEEMNPRLQLSSFQHPQIMMNQHIYQMM